MRKLKHPPRITQTIDTAVTKETVTRDSQNNPEGTVRTTEHTTRKTRKKVSRDSRTQGCEGMRRELSKIKQRVGWLKAGFLRSRGKHDGKLSLPRPTGEGIWKSPFMAREQHAAETYKAHKWAEHEISVSAIQEEAQRLWHEIAETETAIAKKEAAAPAKPTEQELSLVCKQEQGAAPGVIRSRRLNEWKKQNTGYYGALQSLEQRADELRQRRAELLAAIDESACVTRLLCEKKRDLHRQRVDIYYQGVLITHPEKEKIPPVPELFWENFAEKLYEKQHRITDMEVA